MYLNNEFMYWADFQHADGDANIFNKTDILHCTSDFLNTGTPLQLKLVHLVIKQVSIH